MPYATRKYQTRRGTRKTKTYRRNAKNGRNAAKNNSNTTIRAVSLKLPATQKQVGYLPLPRRYAVKLPYTYSASISTTVQNLFGLSTTLRLNSLYDPDNGVGGGQPLGFDQLSPIYARYRVYGALFEIEFINPTADGMYVGFRVRSAVNTSGAGSSGLAALSQRRDTFIKPINNSGSQVVRMKRYVPINVPWGKTKTQIMNDDLFESAITTNPSSEVFGEIFAMCSSQAVATVTFKVKVTYYAIMSGNKTFPEDA